MSDSGQSERRGYLPPEQHRLAPTGVRPVMALTKDPMSSYGMGNRRDYRYGQSPMRLRGPILQALAMSPDTA